MAGRNKVKIYSIILTNRGKQIKTICSEKTEVQIYKRFNELLKENKKVSFPVQYNIQVHEKLNADYELVIIKCKEFGDKDTNKIRDEYGKYTNYETTDEDWIVVDRAAYSIEETFWVYGFHPLLQRKTFDWVFDNIISKDAKNKYMFKTVLVYYNKVIIDCCGKLDMVICKNKQDAIRFYNLVEKWCKEKKFKYVMFIGDVIPSRYKRDWTKRIHDLTGWDNKKINRQSTKV